MTSELSRIPSLKLSGLGWLTGLSLLLVACAAPPPPKRPSAEVKPPLATVSPNPHPKPITNQKVPNEPEVKPETAKESHKANIFSARCSRLLEKVGSGEPMSNAEQQEMVTKCQ